MFACDSHNFLLLSTMKWIASQVEVVGGVVVVVVVVVVVKYWNICTAQMFEQIRVNYKLHISSKYIRYLCQTRPYTESSISPGP
jgi:hypothetical protein